MPKKDKSYYQDINLLGAIQERDISTYPPRVRILAAALKRFVEKGYFNTNVPDLSKDSQCSVGSIYHNFKSKEKVAIALYEEGIKAFRKAIENQVSGRTDPEDIIKSVVEAFLMFAEVNHQLSKYLWLCRHTEFMSCIINHPTRVGFDRLGRILTKAIKKGIREGKIKNLKANIIWSVWFGIPLAYVRDWLDGYNPDPPSKVAPLLAELSWQALKN